MMALRKTGRGKGLVELCEVPEPRLLEETDVLIRVAAAGICGTDIHILQDEFTYYPPVTLGHEFSGTVEALGPGVTRFRQGDFVVAEPHAEACTVCDLCRQGYWQICARKRSPGWGRDGAFTELVRMPEKLLHRVDPRVDPLVAALAEPLAIVISSLAERTGVRLGDFVTVVGAGPIGILSALVAKTCGAGTVVMLGVTADEPLRFPIARKLGADRTVNVLTEDSIALISELTGGRMSDLVVEASGSESGIRSAFRAVRKCGRFCAAGLTGRESVSIPWDLAQGKLLDLYFNMSSSYSSWDRAVSLLETTAYDLSLLITHTGGLDRWEEFVEALGSGRALKAMFIPEHSRQQEVTP